LRRGASAREAAFGDLLGGGQQAVLTIGELFVERPPRNASDADDVRHARALPALAGERLRERALDAPTLVAQHCAAIQPVGTTRQAIVARCTHVNGPRCFVCSMAAAVYSPNSRTDPSVGYHGCSTTRSSSTESPSTTPMLACSTSSPGADRARTP